MTQPRVGVGVVLRRNGRLLLLRRRGAHGAGSWSTPGGNFDLAEDPRDCAVREASEETGLLVSSPRFLGITNDVFEEERQHYVTLWFESEAPAGDVHLSDEASELGWYSEDQLPEPLFLSVRNLVDGRLLK